ncbi:MAG: cell division ATP-binding protein FtsE [Nitrospinae bacterium]|nr:cell division ATP-binding protein FtsE [Nitrospinota bacterium]
MIQLYNVFKTYGGNIPALVDVSLVIREGAFVFVTGPSGAGKTTLLKILFRWENFDSGQVLVNGMNIGKIKESNLYLLRRTIGVVFQDYKLLPHRTVFENIALVQQVVGAGYRAMKARTWEALKSVGLSHKRDAYPLQLSGGEQQRVAIARALVNSPKILLADEPTGNLDPEIAHDIVKLFERANEQGMTVIFATHNHELIRKTHYPYIALNRGNIVRS